MSRHFNWGNEAKGNISFSDKWIDSFNHSTNMYGEALVGQKLCQILGMQSPMRQGSGLRELMGSQDRKTSEPVNQYCAKGKTRCQKSSLRSYLKCTRVSRTGHTLSWTIKIHKNEIEKKERIFLAEGVAPEKISMNQLSYNVEKY